MLLYSAQHSELRIWHEFCVDCSVRCPGSSVPLLSPVRCGCLSTDYLHGLGCKDCFSLTSPSDSTQKTPGDADVCWLQEENKQLTWVFYSFLIRKIPFASRRKILNWNKCLGCVMWIVFFLKDPNKKTEQIPNMGDFKFFINVFHF